MHHIHPCTHTSTPIHSYTVYTHALTHHIQVHPCTHTPHTPMHACTHTPMHSCTHIHLHTFTHVYSHTLTLHVSAGHCPEQAMLFGILRWLWMMSFERYNRFVKQMCYNNHWPMESVANTYLKRAVAHYEQISKVKGLPTCTCTLFGKGCGWKDTEVPDEVVTAVFGMSPHSRPHPHSIPHPLPRSHPRPQNNSRCHSLVHVHRHTPPPVIHIQTHTHTHTIQESVIVAPNKRFVRDSSSTKGRIYVVLSSPRVKTFVVSEYNEGVGLLLLV